MNFLAPWYEKKDASLIAELQREVPKGHVLYNIPVTVLGRRVDKDGVLFALQDGTGRLAAVHLTFQVETDVRRPSFAMFPSEADWIKKMQADHADFEI